MAAGSKEDPWVLKTPPGTSSYTMYEDLAELTHDARNNRMRAT
jgi:hypothetical protein